MKKIIFLCIIAIFVVFIYLFTRDNKQYIVVFGDELCKNKQFSSKIINSKGKNVQNYVQKCERNTSISTFEHSFEQNERFLYQNKQYTMDNMLIKANTIIISLGMNDLLEYNDDINFYSHIDNVLIDMDKLLSIIRYYSKEQIYVYNFYGIDNKYLKYANKRLKDIADQYNVNVIDISSIDNIKLKQNNYELIIKKTLENI